MTFIGLLLLAVILASAGYSLSKSKRNLAGWAILLGLVYYHPLVLNWETYSDSRVAYGLMYLPIAVMAVYGRSVRYAAPRAEYLSINPGIFFGIFVASLVGVETQVGLANLWSMKLLSGQVSDQFSNFSILMYASGTLCAIFSLTKYQRLGIFIACLFILFFVAIGDRTQAAFIGIYGFILYIFNSRVRMFVIAPVALMIVFLLVYGKQIYVYTLTQDLTAFQNFTAFSGAGLSEPVSLNNATEEGMRREVKLPSYLHEFPLYATPISLGNNLHLFQDIYKELIFPWFSESAGAAGNIIIEIFWNYSYIGLLLFGFVLSGFVYGLAKLSIRSSNLAVLSLLLFIVLFMYLPRNSLFSIISHEKKFAYTFLVGWLMARMLAKTTRKL